MKDPTHPHQFCQSLLSWSALVEYLLKHAKKFSLWYTKLVSQGARSRSQILESWALIRRRLLTLYHDLLCIVSNEKI